MTDWIFSLDHKRVGRLYMGVALVFALIGGPLGLGFMEGRQKLLYLPEAHKDFIYAVAGEELGMIGSVGLLLGFGVIILRGMRATLRVNDDFGRFLALGLTVVV